MLAATIVVEVSPPLAADKPCFLVKEFAVDALALSHDGPFPFP